MTAYHIKILLVDVFGLFIMRLLRLFTLVDKSMNIFGGFVQEVSHSFLCTGET